MLVLATVLAFVVAPVFSRSDSVSASEGQGIVRASLSAGTTREVPIPRVGPAPPTRAASTIERRDVIGVVSMNEFSTLSVSQARADAERVTSNAGVDVVGWQEAQHFGSVFASLRQRGWDTKSFPHGAKELAVSWRRSKFEYVSSSSRLVAWGVDQRTGRYPFGNRYIVRVTLRHRPTGRLLSVINTHLPHKAEDRDHPGHWTTTSNAARARFQLERMRKEWEQAPGRWVVGTGDYNFDAVADRRVRLPKAPWSALAPVALSSYAVLGARGLRPTHPPTGRYIDYVHAAKADLRTGTLRFLGHRTITGLNTDHNALLARLVLR